MSEWLGYLGIAAYASLPVLYFAYAVRSDLRGDRALKELALRRGDVRVDDTGSCGDTAVFFDRRKHQVRLRFFSGSVGFGGAQRPGYFTEFFLVLGERRFGVEISPRDFLVDNLSSLLSDRALELNAPEFDEHFLVRSDYGRYARHFLSPQIREAINTLASLADAGDLRVETVRQGLRLQLRGRKCGRAQLDQLVTQGLLVVDGYLDALGEPTLVPEEPKEPASSDTSSDTPSGCAVCGGELSGELVGCQWCGAKQHRACAVDLCPACGALIPERAAQ